MSSAGIDFTWHEVGARIRGMRLARGISQAELAKKAELSAPGLFAIEKGDTNTQLSSLQRIAKVLGCTVRELITGPTSEPRTGIDDFAEQARYVLESGNEIAIANLLNGLETAKLILRSGVDMPSPIMRTYKTDPALRAPTILKGAPLSLRKNRRKNRRSKGQR
jgi:transcriptional regulator with XRE-family HTH domain